MQKIKRNNIEVFKKCIEQSSNHMSCFFTETLVRLLLSYVPMLDYITKYNIQPRKAGSFGSGSCSHEVFLSQAFPNMQMFCFDKSSKYIPKYNWNYILENNNIEFVDVDLDNYEWSNLQSKFDYTFSIQTLEHIEDYQSALVNLSYCVMPGGYIYVDTPHYSEKDEQESSDYLVNERKRQWDKHKHYHLGFSRKRMIDRLGNLGFEIIDSGYYSYHEGDTELLKIIRSSGIYAKVKAEPLLAIFISYLLQNILSKYEVKYRNIFDTIDEAMNQNRVASAIRILARKI